MKYYHRNTKGGLILKKNSKPLIISRSEVHSGIFRSKLKLIPAKTIELNYDMTADSFHSQPQKVYLQILAKSTFDLKTTFRSALTHRQHMNISAISIVRVIT